MLLFTLVSYNDSKFSLPVIIWSLAGLLVGGESEKLISLFVILSWLYLWIVVFKGGKFNKIVVMISAGVLLALLVYQFVVMVNSDSLNSINRNHWFITLSVLYWVSTTSLFYQIATANRK